MEVPSFAFCFDQNISCWKIGKERDISKMRPGSPTRLNHWEIGLPDGGREGRNAWKKKRPFNLENIPPKYPHLLSKRLTSRLLLSRAVTFLCTSIMKDLSYTSCHLSLVALMLACFKVKSKASEGQSKACCLCKVLFPSWNSSGRGLAWSLLWREGSRSSVLKGSWVLLSPAQQGPSGLQGLTSTTSFEWAGKWCRVIKGWWVIEKAQIKGASAQGLALRKGWKEICKRGWQKAQDEVSGFINVTGQWDFIVF